MSKKNDEGNQSISNIQSAFNKKRRFPRKRRNRKMKYQKWDCSPEMFVGNESWEYGKNYIDEKMKELRQEREEENEISRIERRYQAVISLLLSVLVAVVAIVFVIAYLNKQQIVMDSEISALSQRQDQSDARIKEISRQQKEVNFWYPVINNYYTDNTRRALKSDDYIIIIPEENFETETTDYEEIEEDDSFEDSSFFVEQDEDAIELEDSFGEYQEESEEEVSETVSQPNVTEKTEENVTTSDEIVAYYKNIPITAKDLQEIKAISRAEGGHDAYISQQAVAFTIIERAATKGWSIHQVITEPSQYCTYWDGAAKKLSAEEVENASNAVWKAINEGAGPILNEMINQSVAKGLDITQYVGDGPLYFCSETDGTSKYELSLRDNIKVKAWDSSTGLYFYRYWDK